MAVREHGRRNLFLKERSTIQQIGICMFLGKDIDHRIECGTVKRHKLLIEL